MSITKSAGETRTERLLADLCEKSFLKLWSYPNPIKDDRKELCDVLAVFENHVFIFFDRENQLSNSPNDSSSVKWDRWKRNVVDAQIKTANGAERYIRSGRGIFLDVGLQKEFPINVDINKIIVHKIIVAHGAAEACKEFSSANVSGSLAIAYGDPKLSLSIPFMVGIDKWNPVHIFDSHNLPIIFGELDTVVDLVAYPFAMKCKTECQQQTQVSHGQMNSKNSDHVAILGANSLTIRYLLLIECTGISTFWSEFAAGLREIPRNFAST